MKKKIIKILNPSSKNSIYVSSVHKELFDCNDLSEHKTPIKYEAEIAIGYDTICKKNGIL